MKRSLAILFIAVVVLATTVLFSPVGQLYVAIAFGAFGVAGSALIDLAECSASTTYKAIRRGYNA